MSPQLTLSSMFSVLALAGLCVVANARDFSAAAAAPIPYVLQAELSPGLLAD